MPPVRKPLLSLALFALYGCGGGEDPSLPTTVAVSPSVTVVALGDSVPLAAQVRDQNGLDHPGTVTWASRDLDIATVGPFGMVTGRAPGTATIVATFESISGEAMVTVTDDEPPSVSLDAPAEGETVGGVVLVVPEVEDNHSVQRVGLLVDGVEALSLEAPPWEFSWDTRTMENGEYALRVVATDESGNEGSSLGRSVEVANAPVSFGQWEALPPLPIPVRSAAVATDGERVYVMGGSGLGGKTAAVQIFDLGTEMWSMGTSLPSPVDWGTATWVDGLVHFMGGVPQGAGASDQHLVYQNDDWVASVDLPMPIAGTASVASGGDIYVFAGNSGASPAHTAGTLIFDVAMSDWDIGTDVPSPRINWSGTLAGDFIYLIGGGTPGLGTSPDLLRYDPVGDDWMYGPAIPQPREAHGTATLAGLVCAIGGRLAASGNFNTPFDDVSCFDPQSETWYPAPALPQALQEVNAVTVDGAIIAIGGADASTTPVGAVYRLEATPLVPSARRGLRPTSK